MAMSEILSRSQFPNSGWVFFEPSTGWSAPSPKSTTFDTTVTQIIAHRLANPALMLRHKLSTDRTQVANELENFTRARLGMQPMGAGLPKPMPSRTLPQAVLGQVAAVAKMADGIGLLLDFIPNGTPVAPELAAKRAEVCSTCPKNSEKAFLSFFTQPASERLQKMVEARTDLHLATPFDEKLGICEACFCVLKLKTHVPIEFISAKTKQSTLAELDPRCWILSEIQNAH